MKETDFVPSMLLGELSVGHFTPPVSECAKDVRLSFIEIGGLMFVPRDSGGIQYRADTAIGRISIISRHPIHRASDGIPFEVWYPNERAPTGYETMDDIMNWCRDNRISLPTVGLPRIEDEQSP